jgi:hypothetical protein
MFIYDFENVTMGHVVQITPLLLQRIVLLYQKSIPARLKAVHFINLPSSLSSIISISKALLPEQLRDRVSFFCNTLNIHFLQSIFLTVARSQIVG